MLKKNSYSEILINKMIKFLEVPDRGGGAILNYNESMQEKIQNIHTKYKNYFLNV
jgi:hypothetical protein